MKQLIPQPYFSVIITTYDRSNLLIRAIDSLISQTESNWEAIIVDDGSTDDTEEQISFYKDKYPCIQYVKIANNGEAVAKNIGILLSKGKFITFLDSDDEYRLDHLKTRKSLLKQNPFINFLYGGIKIIGNQYVPDRFNQLEKIDLHECAVGGTFFIERELLFSLGGFIRIPYGADADLFDRLTCDNLNVLKTHLPSYIYHHETPRSITNNLNKDLLTHRKSKIGIA